MNPNQPHTPTQPNDDNVVHFSLDHDFTNTPLTPHETSLTRSNNFVDETETGLFDFDLEDLENLFNTPPQTNGAFDTLASAENEKIVTHTTIDPNEHSIMLDKVDLHKVDTAEHLTLDTSPSTHTPLNFEKIDTPYTPNTADINDNVDNLHTEIPSAIHPSHNPAEMTADFSVNSANLASMTAPTLEKSPTVTPEPVVAPTSDSVTTHNSSTTADTAISATAIGTTATVATMASLATKASDSTASAKKGLFSSFGNKKTKPTPATPPTPVAIPTAPPISSDNPPPTITPKIIAKKPAKNNKPLLILLGLLLLGALGWLASQFFAEPEPAPQPAPKATPVAQAPASVAPPIANSAVVTTSPATQASSATAPMTNSATAQSATQATQTTTPNATTKNLIKPEEILSAPLPKDNAIAKEELDRLADQSKQLSQQEKTMEEQLKMMNELASKKEERIAILEKQIAQAEAQKAQVKK